MGHKICHCIYYLDQKRYCDIVLDKVHIVHCREVLDPPPKVHLLQVPDQDAQLVSNTQREADPLPQTTQVKNQGFTQILFFSNYDFQCLLVPAYGCYSRFPNSDHHTGIKVTESAGKIQENVVLPPPQALCCVACPQPKAVTAGICITKAMYTPGGISSDLYRT